MHRWTGTSRPVESTILESVKLSKSGDSKIVSRVFERIRRAEMSGFKGSDEQRVSVFAAAAAEQVLLLLLISFESENPFLLSIQDQEYCMIRKD